MFAGFVLRPLAVVCPPLEAAILDELEPRLLLSAIDDRVSLMPSGSMPFVENAGQWDPAVRFASVNGAGAVLHTDAGPVLRLRDLDDEGQVTQACEVAVEFPGALAVRPEGLEAQPGVYNFLTGPQETWRTGVGGYAAVGYAGLWNGVDLVTRGGSEGLKYEFQVAAGVDPAVVQMCYVGAESLWIDGDGALHVVTPLADLVDAAPEIYQDLACGRVYLSGGYELLSANTVGFEVAGAVDPTAPLVIDPRMMWASYLGGASGDKAFAVAADSDGNVIVGGRTYSADWVSGGYDTTLEGGLCGFVAKLSPTGQHVWSTYIGKDTTYVEDLAVNSTDQIVAVGRTGNGNWGVSGGWDATYGGVGDGFAICLNANGTHAWSTYLGGGGYDAAHAVDIGLADYVYVGGETDSSGWISGGDRTTTDAWRTDYYEGFLVALWPSGQHRWSTYVGDGGINGNTSVNAVEADHQGFVWAGGMTWARNRNTGNGDWIRSSVGFPISWGDYALNNDSTGPETDGFVIRYEGPWGTYICGTFVGGSQSDSVTCLTSDGTGRLLVGGKTDSDSPADWPNPPYRVGGSLTGGAGFVSRISASLYMSIEYVRFLSGPSEITGLVCDKEGNVWAAGYTAWADWPDTEEETAYRGGTRDAFLVGIDANYGAASSVIFLGGNDWDEATDVAVSPDGGVLVCGWTRSDDGWVHTGWDTTYGGSDDGFVAKVGTPQNYAILFNGGSSSCNWMSNYPEFLENIRRVYAVLVHMYDIPPENIWLLNSDGGAPGNDTYRPVGAGVSPEDSDMSFLDPSTHLMSATAANLRIACEAVAAQVKPHDHFFFYADDHGEGTDGDDFWGPWPGPIVRGEEALVAWGEDIPDERVAQEVTKVQTGYCTYVFNHCFSGGILDNIVMWPKRFGSASCNHYEYSYVGGFDHAFIAALERGINTTQAIFREAFKNNPRALLGGPQGTYTPGKEHSWCTGGDFPIFFNIHNDWPTLPAVVTLIGNGTTAVGIPYDLLKAAAQESDPDGGQLGFLIADVTEGTLTLDGEDVTPYESVLYPGQTLLWTPPEGASGTIEAFQVAAFDGTKASELAPVWVAVDALPGGPVADDDTATVDEDSTDNVLDVLGNDTGTGTLQVLDVGQPAHGEVRLEAGQVLYTPADDFSGTDSFTYCMTDDIILPAYATVTITVTAANDDPVAMGNWHTVMEDSQDNELDVLARDFDPDDDDLTVTDVGTASDGTVALVGGAVFYTPPAGWTGEATFTYTISDGQGGSGFGTATVTVQPLDGGPVTAVTPFACDRIERGDCFLMQWDGGSQGETAEVWTLGPTGLSCTASGVSTLDRAYAWDSTGLGEGLYTFALLVDPAGGGAQYITASPSWVLATGTAPPAPTGDVATPLAVAPAGIAAAPAPLVTELASLGDDDSGTTLQTADQPTDALRLASSRVQGPVDFVYVAQPAGEAPSDGSSAPAGDDDLSAGETIEAQWQVDVLSGEELLARL